MFPQFGSTAETLSKASTMVFRIGTDAHLYDDPEDVNIAPLLDSKFDSEKCEALKRLLALVAQGFDVSNFFPQVVKNVASQSLEVKKLVYLYLLHYAEKRPNEALLSINCFQKDLGDPNPLVRAWALRTMAGIRLHVISPLVLVAVRKCARDPSVYVRKCAATALPKLHDLRQEENASAIEEIVQILLNDSSPAVVGAAGAAFASVCPSNLSLIGRNYQRLCEILPDVEEWGQIILIGILLRCVIARYGFAKESIMHSLHCENLPLGMNGATNDISSAEDGNDSNRFVETELTDMVARRYIEGPDEYLSRSSYKNEASQSLNSEYFVCARENNDIKILLQCTSPLLWNNNSAVVLAAAGVHWVMAPRESIEKIVKPLLFLVRSANASKYVVLCNIQVFARAMPSLFAPYFKDFFIFSSDSHQVKAVKLEILSSIATSSSISSIFSEFQDYIRDPDRRFAAGTVAAIGLCAQRLPEMANIFLDSLLLLTRQEFLSGGFVSLDEEAGILIQAITSINLIIREDPSSYEKILIQLIRGLDSIKLPAARAMIIWMVGEYNSLGDTIPRMLPIVVKYLARHFTAEELEAKLQILNTMTKVFLCAKEEDVLTFKTVLDYLFELALCDLNYDLRDRARFLKKLLLSHLDIGVTKEEKTGDPFLMLAEGILKRQTKPASPEPMNYRFYLPGSLSQIVLHAAPGYEPLPKPCTLLQVIDSLGEGATSNVPYEADDLDSLSGSLDEESASDYTSQNSERGSYGSDGSNEADNPSEKGDNNADPLIQLSDVSNPHRTGNAQSRNADTGALMSKNALESWLDEQPGLGSLSISEQTQVHISSARISIGDIAEQVKPKSYRLLDPAYGNGLKVEYSFSSQVSNISPLLVCIEVSFRNCTTEPMSDITLVQEESNKVSDSMDQDLSAGESSLTSNNNEPTSVTMEGISSLEPDQTINRILQVRFNHHLLPLKLDLYCNGKRHPVKLRPDIGYFVKPLHMDSEAFTKMEKDLPGMFEYRRICTFTDHIAKQNEDRGDIGQLVEDTFLVICKSLALKILSNANIYLVSVDLPVAAGLQDASGLFLRFSGEILSNSIPCLITITVEEGRCSEPLTLSVKVNCEETVFSLNLLNRVVNFLVEPPLTNS